MSDDKDATKEPEKHKEGKSTIIRRVVTPSQMVPRAGEKVPPSDPMAKRKPPEEEGEEDGKAESKE